jgi:predicted dienelactone hydrolase
LAGAGGRGGGAAGSSGAGGSPLPPITDYSAPGPFPTMMQQNTGPDGKYTIVRPQTLGQNGFLHAPIIFGPGIGMEVTGLGGLLARFASHGFVVIGKRLDGPPNAAANRTAMLDGLNWIRQQNAAAGSVFQGKLEVTRAISMGYSVGGTAAVEIGNHEAVVTVVSIHGHRATSALHGPMLQTSGTNDTVGLPMQQYTYDNSQVQTFLATVSGADHGYIQTTVAGVPGGVQTPAIVAWLRYWIYNDSGGRRYFYGNDCVMCTAPWTNPQRKNWQ